MAFPGKYIIEFTLVSFGLIFLVFALVALAKKETPDRPSLKYAFPAGIAMGLMNFITLALSAHMDASVLFPLVTIFSSIFNLTASVVLFKEKFTPLKLAGIALGIVSVILIK